MMATKYKLITVKMTVSRLNAWMVSSHHKLLGFYFRVVMMAIPITMTIARITVR